MENKLENEDTAPSTPPSGLLKTSEVECTHCWHDTGVMLTSDPPQVVDRCCLCGKTRNLRIMRDVPKGTHGPFAPR